MGRRIHEHRVCFVFKIASVVFDVVEHPRNFSTPPITSPASYDHDHEDNENEYFFFHFLLCLRGNIKLLISSQVLKGAGVLIHQK